MDCSCSVNLDVDYIEYPKFCSQSIRTARKEHFCSECKKIIQPKEKYEHTAGLWDEKISIFKTCNDCLSVRNSCFTKGYSFGSLWFDLREEINEGFKIYSHCLIEMTPIARAKVCDLMEAFWFENDD